MSVGQVRPVLADAERDVVANHALEHGLRALDKRHGYRKPKRNVIAEGHTMDDQAETVLIALVRGGGLEALAGIAPVVGREIQPLLDVTRTEVESACRSLRLRPRTDPTNADTRLLRNAIRLVGLPALEAATGRELHATIAREVEIDEVVRQEHALERLAAKPAPFRFIDIHAGAGAKPLATEQP